MNLKLIKELRTMRDYPAVSILTPSHRTAPDNLQDPIRVKNLVTEAQARLLSEFPRRDVEPILERLDFLVSEIDWRYTLDGLALFASKEFAARFDLPFSPTERVAIDETFATRELAFTMNRSPRYYVLVLSDQPTRLFEAIHDKLHELRLGEFPIDHQGPGGERPMPGGYGVQQSAYRDEYDRQFFRKVDEELTRVLAEDTLPIIVTGVRRNLAFWDEISANKSHIAGTLEGSYESINHHELGQLVWPVMQEFMAARRNEVLDQLDEAVGTQRFAAGIGETWQMAQEGCCETLLVEEDFHYASQLDSTGLLMSAEPDLTDAHFMSDAVDDLIETVLDKGGRVVFFDKDKLKNYNRIATILRW